MIKVTFEFEGVDQAIVALSKLVGVPSGPRVARAEGIPKAGVTDPRSTAAGSAAGASTSTVLIPGTPTIQSDKPPRKPRADRGQPRGPRQQEANAAGGTPAGTQPATASGQSTPAQAPAAPVAAASTAPLQPSAVAVPETGKLAAATTATTAEDVQAALEKLFNAKGEAMCHTIFAYFGVKRGRDLKPEQRAEFIAKANEALAAV